MHGYQNLCTGRLKFLILIWCAFVARGVFYSAVFPVWEGYDEPFHFAFIQYLVTQKKLPTPATLVSKEVQASLHSLPLPGTILRHGYPPPLITHDEFWKLDRRQREHLQQEFQNIPKEWAREPASEPIRNYEAQQPPLYYLLFSVPLRALGVLDLSSRVLLLRILGIVVASAAIPLGYLVSRKVLGNETSALGIVALASVMPEMMVNISRVANESLAITFYTLLVYVTLKIVDGPEHFNHLAFVGLLLGLGLLTKAYFLTALPALVMVLAWCLWRWPNQWKRLALHSGLMIAIAAGMAGWWYWRAHQVMASWSGLYSEAAVPSMSKWQMLQQLWQVNWLSALISVLLSHIWYGGWSFLRVSNFLYVAFGAIVLLAVAGVAILLLKLRKAGASVQEESVHPGYFGVLVSFYGFFWVGLAYQILTLYISERASASTGWYMYCLVVPELILAYLGLQAVLPARLHSWIIPSLTTAFALLDLYGLHFLLIPYYSGLISRSAIYRGVFSHSTLSWVPPARIQDFAQTSLSVIGNRILINKSPILITSTLSWLWLLYISATLWLVVCTWKVIDHGKVAKTQNSTPAEARARNDVHLASKKWITIMKSRTISVLAGVATLLSFTTLFSVICFAQSEEITSEHKMRPASSPSHEWTEAGFSMSSEHRTAPAASAGETGRVGVGVKFSSLGAGVEAAASITAHSNVRGGFNVFRYSKNFTKDSIPFNGQVVFQSVEALYDWFPFRGAFHLSPGVLAYNSNQIKASTSIAGGRTFTLGGTTYMSDPANPVSGTGKTNLYRVAPMFLVGYGNLVPRSGKHFSIPIEAGFVIQGSPNVSLNLTGSVCNPTGGACRSVSDPVIQSHVQAEQKTINSDISFLRVYPVISVGFAFKF